MPGYIIFIKPERQCGHTLTTYWTTLGRPEYHDHMIMSRVTLLCTQVEVESGGILELKLDRYQNSTRCAEGSTGLITGDCDYRFTLQAKAQLTAR